MATIKRFEDIEAWKKARVMDNKIFEIANAGRLAKDYPLRDQMLRSSGSIMDNVAEGFERSGKGEFIQFLSISKGSAGELRSQLYRALDRKYITEETFEKMKTDLEGISGMLQGFMSYLGSSNLKGVKYINNSKR